MQDGLQVFATWLLLEIQQVRTLSCQLLGFGRVIVVLLATAEYHTQPSAKGLHGQPATSAGCQGQLLHVNPAFFLPSTKLLCDTPQVTSKYHQANFRPYFDKGTLSHLQVLQSLLEQQLRSITHSPVPMVYRGNLPHLQDAKLCLWLQTMQIQSCIKVQWHWQKATRHR